MSQLEKLLPQPKPETSIDLPIPSLSLWTYLMGILRKYTYNSLSVFHTMANKFDTNDDKNLEEIADKYKIVESALNNFLIKCNSDLSDQNFARASKHLLKRFSNYQDLTSIVIENYLYKLLEYKDYQVNEIDKDGEDCDELAEELLMNIIITANKKVTNPSYTPPTISLGMQIKRFFTRLFELPIYLKIILFLATITTIGTPSLTYYYVESRLSAYEISQQNGDELRDMVSEVVRLEEKLGKKTNSGKIWKLVKEHETITQHGGYKRSYRKFSILQYEAAKKYLARLINDLSQEASSTQYISSHKKH